MLPIIPSDSREPTAFICGESTPIISPSSVSTISRIDSTARHPDAEENLDTSTSSDEQGCCEKICECLKSILHWIVYLLTCTAIDLSSTELASSEQSQSNLSRNPDIDLREGTNVLDLANPVTENTLSFPREAAQAKLDRAHLLREGTAEIQKDYIKALELFDEVINDQASTPEMRTNAKYHKAQLFYQGGYGIEENIPEALILFSEVSIDQNSTPEMRASAKMYQARILYYGGNGLEINEPDALALFNDVIHDQGSTAEMRATAKYQKAKLLCHGGNGIVRNEADASTLLNEVVNDQNSTPEIIAGAAFLLNRLH
jgi:uncharacterized protein (UPF0147 family)